MLFYRFFVVVVFDIGDEMEKEKIIKENWNKKEFFKIVIVRLLIEVN